MIYSYFHYHFSIIIVLFYIVLYGLILYTSLYNHYKVLSVFVIGVSISYLYSHSLHLCYGAFQSQTPGICLLYQQLTITDRR